MLQNKLSPTLATPSLGIQPGLLHLQVPRDGATGPELVRRLPGVPVSEAAAHALGFAIQDIEGQQLLRETLHSHPRVRDKLCPH